MSLLRNSSDIQTIEKIRHQWKLLCQRPPKGFEKYFKPGKSAKEAPKQEQSAKTPPKDAQSKDAPPPPRKEVPPSSNNPKQSFFNFTNGNKSGSGSGKPFEGTDKWLIFGALGAMGIIGMVFFVEGGREVTWREFVYK